MSFRQVALVTYSKEDGPKTVVSRLRKIEVRDATPKDVVRIVFGDHDLVTTPSALLLRGSMTKHVNFPRGTVRVERVEGTSPITVLAHCERYMGNGTAPIKRHDLR